MVNIAEMLKNLYLLAVNDLVIVNRQLIFQNSRSLVFVGDVSYNQYESGPKGEMQLQVAERQIEVGGKNAAQAVCS